MLAEKRACGHLLSRELDSKRGPRCQACEAPRPCERRSWPDHTGSPVQLCRRCPRPPPCGARALVWLPVCHSLAAGFPVSEPGETPRLYCRAWQVTQGHVPLAVHLGPPRKVSPGPGSGTGLPLDGAGRGGHERLDRTQGDREVPLAARDPQLLESLWSPPLGRPGRSLRLPVTRRERSCHLLLRLGDAKSGIWHWASCPPASCRSPAGASSPDAGLDLLGDSQPSPPRRPRPLSPGTWFPHCCDCEWQRGDTAPSLSPRPPGLSSP